MRLLLSKETLSANHSKEISNREFDQRQVLVGRDVSADIRIESRYVSLRHALIYERDQRLFIEDQGSLSGILINQQPQKIAILNEGDEIRIGDVQFRVTSDRAPYALKQLLDETENLNLKEQISRDVDQLNIGALLTKMRMFGLIAVLGTIFAFILIPAASSNRPFWAPGPMTSAHRPIPKDCNSCHTADFDIVPNAKCVSCHSLTEHFPLSKDSSKDPTRCVDCHSEHRGEGGLFSLASQTCQDCHASEPTMKLLKAETKLPLVPSWKHHPKFPLLFPDRKANFKFNHQVHLEKALWSPEGDRTLDCSNCHLSPSHPDRFEPISFQRDCSECHRLDFDERLKEFEVSHGRPDEVFSTLLKIYRTQTRVQEKERGLARRPGKRLEPMKSPDEEARLAEIRLFEQKACSTCHVIEKKKVAAKGVSAYQVLRVGFPSEWVENKSSFTHRQHQAFACSNCHTSVLSSTSAEDLNIPGVAECQSCHSPEVRADAIKTQCSDCHSYHETLRLPKEGSWHP